MKVFAALVVTDPSNDKFKFRNLTLDSKRNHTRYEDLLIIKESENFF